MQCCVGRKYVVEVFRAGLFETMQWRVAVVFGQAAVIFNGYLNFGKLGQPDRYNFIKQFNFVHFGDGIIGLFVGLELHQRVVTSIVHNFYLENVAIDT